MNFIGIQFIIFLATFEAVYTGSELLEYIEDEKDCPSPDDRILPQAKPQVPWNVEGRAFLTVPPDIILKNSSIPNAGLGIFALTFIPRYTWLGEYEGEVIDDIYSDYVWRVHRGGEVNHYIDGENIATSNWLRYVNCPRTIREENVDVLECMGKVFYISKKDIYPGQELFIFYGDEYAEYLGLKLTDFYGS